MVWGWHCPHAGVVREFWMGWWMKVDAAVGERPEETESHEEVRETNPRYEMQGWDTASVALLGTIKSSITR